MQNVFRLNSPLCPCSFSAAVYEALPDTPICLPTPEAEPPIITHIPAPHTSKLKENEGILKMILRWGAVAENQREQVENVTVLMKVKLHERKDKQTCVLYFQKDRGGPYMYDPTHHEKRWGRPDEAERGVALSQLSSWFCCGLSWRSSDPEWALTRQETVDGAGFFSHFWGGELTQGNQSHHFLTWFGRHMGGQDLCYVSN